MKEPFSFFFFFQMCHHIFWHERLRHILFFSPKFKSLWTLNYSNWWSTFLSKTSCKILSKEGHTLAYISKQVAFAVSFVSKCFIHSRMQIRHWLPLIKTVMVSTAPMTACVIHSTTRSQANHSSQLTVTCSEKKTESEMTPCILSCMLALLQVFCCYKALRTQSHGTNTKQRSSTDGREGFEMQESREWYFGARRFSLQFLFTLWDKR